ncbi:MAG: hypothetical protein CMH83_04375 [Nocardioides sp.]|nr:hypothetical protein [Nocardioides sp.]
MAAHETTVDDATPWWDVASPYAVLAMAFGALGAAVSPLLFGIVAVVAAGASHERGERHRSAALLVAVGGWVVWTAVDGLV